MLHVRGAFRVPGTMLAWPQIILSGIRAGSWFMWGQSCSVVGLR